MDSASRIAGHLARVRERIDAAARRAGRDPQEVVLVAVTKTVGLEAIRELVDLGVRDLGENRPQQLLERVESLAPLPSDLTWHLVGTLQRNKARRILPAVGWIHAVDSLRLLEALDRIAREDALRPRVLLEVNVSGEESKHGFGPDDLLAAWEQVLRCEAVEVRGLMTMAPATDVPETVRPVFAALRRLRDDLARRSPPDVRLDRLSMGMSGDFEPAVEEGATFVRIGTALFA
jgi:pyridoxal phosphate enzyme (YggS family)